MKFLRVATVGCNMKVANARCKMQVGCNIKVAYAAGCSTEVAR